MQTRLNTSNDESRTLKTPFELLSEDGLYFFSFKIPGIQSLFSTLDRWLFPLETRRVPDDDDRRYHRHSLQYAYDSWAGLFLGGFQPWLDLYYKELNWRDYKSGYHLKRDVITPLRGIYNVLTGFLNCILSVILWPLSISNMVSIPFDSRIDNKKKFIFLVFSMFTTSCFGQFLEGVSRMALGCFQITQTLWMPLKVAYRSGLLQPGKALSVSRYVDDDTGFQEVLQDIERLENFSDQNKECTLSNGYTVQLNYFDLLSEHEGQSFEGKTSLSGARLDCFMRLSRKMDKANMQGRKFKLEQANIFMERVRDSGLSTHSFIFQNNPDGTKRYIKDVDDDDDDIKLEAAATDLVTIFRS